MKLLLTILFVATTLSCTTVSTNSIEQRFSQEIDLSDQWRVFIEETEQEPRSVGSYAVRLYAITSPQFPFDDFRQGLIAKRDGTLERLLVSDRDTGSPVRFSVVIRSAGSGGYLHVDTYGLIRNGISLVSRCRDLPPDTDVTHLVQSESLNTQCE